MFITILILCICVALPPLLLLLLVGMFRRFEEDPNRDVLYIALVENQHRGAVANVLGKIANMEEEDVEVWKELLPLNRLRDFVPVPKSLRGKREAKLSAALVALEAGSGPGPTVKVGFEAGQSEDEDTGRKATRKSILERFFCRGENEAPTCHLLQYLESKELVSLTTASCRLRLYSTRLRFAQTLSIAALARLGSSGLRAKKGKPVLGVLQNCSLNVGAHSCSLTMDGMGPLEAFFNGATRDLCSVERFAIHLDASVNDLAIQQFLQCFQKPVAIRLRHLSLESCMIGQDGLEKLCGIMRTGSLPVLELLNVARNNAQYGGIHKLAATVASNCCPHLATLFISNNSARSAVLDFFDSSFATKTPFLTTLEATNNEIDLLDPDVLAIVNRDLLTWRNFVSLDLSHNPLGDSAFAKLLRQIWPLSADKSTIILESLSLQSVELGINSLAYLCRVMMERDWTALGHLFIGANTIDLAAVKFLLEPITSQKVRLCTLSLPLNNIQPEGVVLFQNVVTMGFFDSLEVLDLSDVGANSDAIAILARALLLRWRLGALKLKRLKVFGICPVAGKSARVLFGKEFLDKINVS